MRKIAILGKCSSSRHHAPMGAMGWEIWCLAWDPTPIVHRLYECHVDWRNFHGKDSDDAALHRRWLMGQKVPVYMHQVENDIPMSVRYPMNEIADLIGRTSNGTPYLESSMAYMMAHAIYEFSQSHRSDGMKIGIWGVDLAADTEYSYQRPNMEYLIGLARGMGINVYVPKVSSMLSHANGKPYGFWTPLEGGTARMVNVGGKMVEMSNAEADFAERAA